MKIRIIDAIQLLANSIFVIAFQEIYQITNEDILSVREEPLTVYLKPTVIDKINQILTPTIDIIKNDDHVTIPYIDIAIIKNQSIINKFPFLFATLNKDNYENTEVPIDCIELFNRCQKMQTGWKNWGGFNYIHLITALQALQRYLAARMKIPLGREVGSLENGLSIEYQAELYAEKRYGARLLDGWHAYLMGPKPETKNPVNFLPWLKSLSKIELNQLGINNVDEIPIVYYMESHEDRLPWLLEFGALNSVNNKKIKSPNSTDDTLEIIFDVGISQGKLQFFGGIKEFGFINHSSFFSGKPITGAGKMKLVGKEISNNNYIWVIDSINDDSGHYKPNDQMSLHSLQALQSQGIDLAKVKWHSKWGTAGLNNETADVALKRLVNELTDCDVQPFHYRDRIRY